MGFSLIDLSNQEWSGAQAALSSAASWVYRHFVWPLVPWCAVVAVITLLERIWPLRPVRGIFLSLRTEYGFLVAQRIWSLLFLGAMGPYIRAWAHAPLIPWLRTPPFIIQLALLIVFIEFIDYWYHRAYHTVPLLWEFHRTHHSIEDINAVNGNLRNHLVEMTTSFLVLIFPALCLGFSGEVVYTFSMIGLVINTWKHCNLAWTYGWLNKWVATPQVHQYHHNGERPYNVNYGNWFMVCDRLFGTYYLPEAEPYPERLGLDPDAKTSKYPYPVTGWWKQHFYPLRRLLPKGFFKQPANLLPYEKPGVIPKRLLAKAARGEPLAPTLSGSLRDPQSKATEKQLQLR
jgi:sterol desaturase/sphingolipid hydroxylase (fatty acid hydroxylase superfamily)